MTEIGVKGKARVGIRAQNQEVGANLSCFQASGSQDLLELGGNS